MLLFSCFFNKGPVRTIARLKAFVFKQALGALNRSFTVTSPVKLNRNWGRFLYGSACLLFLSNPKLQIFELHNYIFLATFQTASLVRKCVIVNNIVSQYLFRANDKDTTEVVLVSLSLNLNRYFSKRNTNCRNTGWSLFCCLYCIPCIHVPTWCVPTLFLCVYTLNSPLNSRICPW